MTSGQIDTRHIFYLGVLVSSPYYTPQMRERKAPLGVNMHTRRGTRVDKINYTRALYNECDALCDFVSSVITYIMHAQAQEARERKRPMSSEQESR